MDKEIPEYLEAELQTAKDEYKVKTRSYITITKFEYEKLQQENQQLKEDNTTLRENYENAIKLLKENKKLKEENEILRGHHKEMVCYAYDLLQQRDKYKSILDEIREYINNLNVWYEHNDNICSLEDKFKNDILDILDKVKE